MNTPVPTATNVHHLRAITASRISSSLFSHDDAARRRGVTGHIRARPVVMEVWTDTRQPTWTTI
jgi:hypothetical protein